MDSQMQNLIAAHVRESIGILLNDIEQKHNVKIIHAVESGSRAWGFPSKNSDFDIRFIYCHQPDWYITPFERKDTIEALGAGDLDASGWDLGKTLALLYKGNAVLHEWLHCPLVYHSIAEPYAQLKEFAQQEFNPVAAFYHYVSLAKRKFLDEATATNAKYFLYALRSLLCAKHISVTNDVPPVLFGKLVNAYLNSELQFEVDELLTRKLQVSEMDAFVIPPTLWSFAQSLFAELQLLEIGGGKRSQPEAYETLMRRWVNYF